MFPAPSAPVDVSATSPTFSVISLTWSDPLIPNGIIRDYQVTYFPTADSSTVTTLNISSAALEFNITGLTAFTNYTISVTAITIELGDTSGEVFALTLESSKFAKHRLKVDYRP